MRQRHARIGRQFAPRPIEMLESPPYRVLSLSARRVLDRVEIELANHGGKDNGKLPVTYDDFQAYGIHRHSISAAIRECVALGFLEITEPGRAGNADFRAPNVFRLTYRHTKRESATDEWKRIQTTEQAELVARISRKPVPENAIASVGNRHRNHSAETNTTSHSPKTITTLDISGGMNLRTGE
jgi:hypothetical protein